VNSNLDYLEALEARRNTWECSACGKPCEDHVQTRPILPRALGVSISPLLTIARAATTLGPCEQHGPLPDPQGCKWCALHASVRVLDTLVQDEETS
jgi:hypothetical protein